MAREIDSRLRICGDLLCKTPLHIGGTGANADTDLPLSQNGKNKFYVPGTSIAGVLRDWCLKHFDKNLIEEMFGCPIPDKGQASFVLIEDAVIETDVLTEIRDGVRIDRLGGTAADNFKFDREILPRGTKLKFVMTVETQKDSAGKTKAVIGHLLEAMTQSKLRFGAAKTRGLGRVKLDNCTVKEECFIGHKAVCDFLDNKSSDKTLLELQTCDTNIKPHSASKLSITISWKPCLPTMVKSGYDGIAVDMLPLVSGVDDENLALVLPGSSIKGAFRAHAERIIRTLLDSPAEKDVDKQIMLPLISEVFGAKGERENKNQANCEKSACHLKHGLGALAVDDCYAKKEFEMNAESWREVESAEGRENKISHTHSDLQIKLTAANALSKFHPTMHTAVDRFTGAAAETALYSVLAPKKMEWDEIEMTLDFGRLAKCLQFPALMLMLLVLRDIAQNRLPFGFATNRGMGEIAVSEIKIESAELQKIGLADDLKIELDDGKFSVSATNKDLLIEEWKKWLTNTKAK